MRLFCFGDSGRVRMGKALDSLRRGQGVIVVDDFHRENEGDIIFSAQHLTSPQMALLVRECSGIVCYKDRHSP